MQTYCFEKTYKELWFSETTNNFFDLYRLSPDLFSFYTTCRLIPEDCVWRSLKIILQREKERKSDSSWCRWKSLQVMFALCAILEKCPISAYIGSISMVNCAINIRDNTWSFLVCCTASSLRKERRGKWRHGEEEKESIDTRERKGNDYPYRTEIRWIWEHPSSINVVYFSSHLCKPIHEIQQVGRPVSFLLLVQAQKHLLLLLQEKNKYLTGGRHKRSIIWMAFSSLKCKPMLKNLSLHSLSLTQRANKETTNPDLIHHSSLRTKGHFDLITVVWKQP